MEEDKPPHAAAPTAAPQGRAGLPHRILVVDDDDSIRELNARVLALSGYHVDAAADGEDAWQALNTDNYDLLITDHKMPKMTGIELLQRLHAARMGLPAIMVTSTFPEEELNRHPWLQPFATLLKPFTPDQLDEYLAEAQRERAGE